MGSDSKAFFYGVGEVEHFDVQSLKFLKISLQDKSRSAKIQLYGVNCGKWTLKEDDFLSLELGNEAFTENFDNLLLQDQHAEFFFRNHGKTLVLILFAKTLNSSFDNTKTPKNSRKIEYESNESFGYKDSHEASRVKKQDVRRIKEAIDSLKILKEPEGWGLEKKKELKNALSQIEDLEKSSMQHRKDFEELLKLREKYYDQELKIMEKFLADSKLRHELNVNSLEKEIKTKDEVIEKLRQNLSFCIMSDDEKIHEVKNLQEEIYNLKKENEKLTKSLT
jgi:hypothetical protein